MLFKPQKYYRNINILLNAVYSENYKQNTDNVLINKALYCKGKNYRNEVS